MNLPASDLYEKSYMHRDIVDNVVCAVKTNFVFTTSLEGILKIWKKNYVGIEYVKQYKAHKGKITGISVSSTDLYLSTCSHKDESLKVFDVVNFDMINFVKLNFVPFLCEFINRKNDPAPKVAVTEKETGIIHIIKAEGKGEVLKAIKLHQSNITAIKFNEPFDAVVSADSKGLIEYWDASTYGKHFFT